MNRSPPRYPEQAGNASPPSSLPSFAVKPRIGVGGPSAVEVVTDRNAARRARARLVDVEEDEPPVLEDEDDVGVVVPLDLRPIPPSDYRAGSQPRGVGVLLLRRQKPVARVRRLAEPPAHLLRCLVQREPAVRSSNLVDYEARTFPRNRCGFALRLSAAGQEKKRRDEESARPGKHHPYGPVWPAPRRTPTTDCPRG